jgi:deoxyribonuclease V
MKNQPSSKNSIPDLYDIVYDLTSQVPEGMVTTYGAIARALGDVKAARAIGGIEHENTRPVLIPCHRVVYADGGLSGFGAPGGAETKKKLLAIEGVRVRDGKIAGFDRRLFTDFDLKGVPPLEKLRALQDELKKKVELKNGFNEVKTVCGIDISYDGRTAYGAAVVIDHKTKDVVEKTTVKTKVIFPYIPTYLAFRELPIVIRLMDKLKKRPTLLMIDGNGILHPRNFGVASHIGVNLDMPVMGAAKKKLCGEFDGSGLKKEGDSAPVMLEKRSVGHTMISSPRSSKPIFISPGNRISGRTALRVAKNFTGNRMLMPIKEAHMLANETRKKNMINTR